MTDKDEPYVIHEDHLISALSEAIPALKKKEEARCGEGWCSTHRYVLEEAYRRMCDRRPVEFRYRR